MLLEPCANLCLCRSPVILGFVYSRILKERRSTSGTFQRRPLRGCDRTIACICSNIYPSLNATECLHFLPRQRNLLPPSSLCSTLIPHLPHLGHVSGSFNMLLSSKNFTNSSPCIACTRSRLHAGMFRAEQETNRTFLKESKGVPRVTAASHYTISLWLSVLDFTYSSR